MDFNSTTDFIPLTSHTELGSTFYILLVHSKYILMHQNSGNQNLVECVRTSLFALFANALFMPVGKHFGTALNMQLA